MGLRFEPFAIFVLCIGGFVSTARSFLEVVGVSGLVPRLEFWMFIFFFVVFVSYLAYFIWSEIRRHRMQPQKDDKTLNKVDIDALKEAFKEALKETKEEERQENTKRSGEW